MAKHTTKVPTQIEKCKSIEFKGVISLSMKGQYSVCGATYAHFQQAINILI